MDTNEIRTEISKRESGAKSNKCLLGCGRRTSSNDYFHYDCYLAATIEDRKGIYQETHAR